MPKTFLSLIVRPRTGLVQSESAQVKQRKLAESSRSRGSAKVSIIADHIRFQRHNHQLILLNANDDRDERRTVTSPIGATRNGTIHTQDASEAAKGQVDPICEAILEGACRVHVR